jgi:hypothetical protein
MFNCTCPTAQAAHRLRPAGLKNFGEFPGGPRNLEKPELLMGLISVPIDPVPAWAKIDLQLHQPYRTFLGLGRLKCDWCEKWGRMAALPANQRRVSSSTPPLAPRRPPRSTRATSPQTTSGSVVAPRQPPP